MELKVPNILVFLVTILHPRAHEQSPLPIKIRDALMTWEITRVLGVLCEVCVQAQSLSHVPLFVTLWIVAGQVLPSMGFYRQEYWSRLPFHPQEKSKTKC